MYKASNWELTSWSNCTTRQRWLRVLLYASYSTLIGVGIYRTLDEGGFSFFIIFISSIFFKDIILQTKGDLRKKQRGVTILLVTSALSAALCYFLLRDVAPIVKILIYFTLMIGVLSVMIWQVKRANPVAVETPTP